MLRLQGILGCRKSEVGKSASITFLICGYFLATFSDASVTFSSLFLPRTPFAGLLLRQGEGRSCVLGPQENRAIFHRAVTLRAAKPGGFQTGAFPLFSGKVQIVSRTLSGLFLVGALKRPRFRKRKGTNRENPPDHPRANRENARKIGKVPKRTKNRDALKGTNLAGQNANLRFSAVFLRFSCENQRFPAKSAFPKCFVF